MKNILEDAKLNRLRMEGGTFLARIRKDDMCENENYRYCCMFAACLLHIFCMSAACVMHVCHANNACLLHTCCVSVACLRCNGSVYATCLLCVWCLPVAHLSRWIFAMRLLHACCCLFLQLCCAHDTCLLCACCTSAVSAARFLHVLSRFAECLL